MPTISDPVRVRPASLQQLADVSSEEVRGLGRMVRLADESYTVSASDDMIVLAATTSVGDYTLTYPTGAAADGMPDGHEVTALLPAALGGTDSYQATGPEGGPLELDAAGDHLTCRYLKAEDQWHVVNNGIA